MRSTAIIASVARKVGDWLARDRCRHGWHTEEMPDGASRSDQLSSLGLSGSREIGGGPNEQCALGGDCRSRRYATPEGSVWIIRSTLPFVRGVSGRVRTSRSWKRRQAAMKAWKAIRGPVVGHQFTHDYTVFGKPRQGTIEKRDRRPDPFISKDLGIRVSRSIVDADVQDSQAIRRTRTAVTGEAMPITPIRPSVLMSICSSSSTVPSFIAAWWQNWFK